MHLDEESYEKPFQFIENQWINGGVWALFPLRTASRMSGEPFSVIFLPDFASFQHRGIAQGVVLDDSGAFWEYGKKPISKMNAHKCEQSVRPVDEVSGRVIGYKKRINIITDLDSQTLKI